MCFLLVVKYTVRDINELDSNLLLMISIIFSAFHLKILHEHLRVHIIFIIIDAKHKYLVINISEVQSDQIIDAELLSFRFFYTLNHCLVIFSITFVFLMSLRKERRLRLVQLDNFVIKKFPLSGILQFLNLPAMS